MKSKEEILLSLRGVKVILENLDKTVGAVWIQHTIDYIESLKSNRIDEERLKEMYEERYRHIAGCELYPHWTESATKNMMDKYNSTLPQGIDWKKVYEESLNMQHISNTGYESKITELEAASLQPLSKEMPDRFRVIHNNWSPIHVWDWVVNTYGTFKREK